MLDYQVFPFRNKEERTKNKLLSLNFDILKDGLDVVLDLVNWHDFIGIIQSSGFVNQNIRINI